MPTVFREGPYRFFFYSGDGVEPRHIHVERDELCAKFWLEPVRLQNSAGFGSKDVKRIRSIIERRQNDLVEAWDEYFGD